MTTAIHTEEQILSMLASGKYNDSEIARAVSLSPSTIGRFKAQNQDKINIYIEKIFNRLPAIIENDFNMIRLAGRLSRYLCDPSLTDNVTGVQATKDILVAIKQAVDIGKEYKQAVGVSPTHTTAPAIVQYNQQNNYGALSSDQLDYIRYKKDQANKKILASMDNDGLTDKIKQLNNDTEVIDITNDSEG